MEEASKQVHPFPPLYNERSKVLILGSFPSVKSREQEFFYGHPQNRFWKVLSEIFECNVPETINDKKELVLQNGLALWDVIAECDISGSSDMSIKNVKPNDLDEILSSGNIRQIFVNGKTAEKYYVKYTEQKTGIKAKVLPSTSPANAAWTNERLVEEWSVIKNYL